MIIQPLYRKGLHALCSGQAGVARGARVKLRSLTLPLLSNPFLRFAAEGILDPAINATTPLPRAGVGSWRNGRDSNPR